MENRFCWNFDDVIIENNTDHMKANFSWRPWSSFEPSLSSAIFSALQSILEFLIGKASEEIGADTGIWTQSLNILRDKAAPVMQDIASKAAKDIQVKLSTTSVSISYDLMNVNAREWALQYAGSQIKNITDTTQKAVQKAIADWITTGRDQGIEGLKIRIRDLKGEDGVPLFGERRADRIAQNEATSIYAGATERGLIDNGYPKTVCKPRAHVNCRCYIQPGRTPDGDKVIVWYTAKDEMVCTQELETPFGVIAGCRNLHKTIISEGRAGEKLETNRKSMKGGVGSGENEGHPFRGNQWADSGVAVELDNDDLKSMVNADPYYGRDFSYAVGEEIGKEWRPSKETVDIYNSEENHERNSTEIIQAEVGGWTGSSGNIISQQIIGGVAKRLGHGDVKTNDWLQERPGFVKDFNAAGEIMYKKTQLYLSKNKIKTVRLYRSSLTDNISGRVFTSWSTSPGFFITSDRGRKNYYADIPASQIFSTYATGFGNVVEREVVVIGYVKLNDFSRKHYGPGPHENGSDQDG